MIQHYSLLQSTETLCYNTYLAQPRRIFCLPHSQPIFTQNTTLPRKKNTSTFEKQQFYCSHIWCLFVGSIFKVCAHWFLVSVPYVSRDIFPLQHSTTDLTLNTPLPALTHIHPQFTMFWNVVVYRIFWPYYTQFWVVFHCFCHSMYAHLFCFGLLFAILCSIHPLSGLFACSRNLCVFYYKPTTYCTHALVRAFLVCCVNSPLWPTSLQSMPTICSNQFTCLRMCPQCPRLTLHNPQTRI